MAAEILTWEEFKDEAAKIRPIAFPLSPILFRGQANADWKLETTLERSGHGETVAEYYHLMLRVKTEVEITTGIRWDNYPALFDLTYHQHT